MKQILSRRKPAPRKGLGRRFVWWCNVTHGNIALHHVDRPREKTAIQVIERMMKLLDTLASKSDPVSLKDLAAATSLHPSTAHRILNDMVIGRFVDRGETPGSYRLGMRLLELGNLVKARLSVREAALEPMRELHRKTGQTVNLSVRQGDEIVYIDRSYSERSGMQVVRAIGGRAPLHLTSSGKLFLASDDPRLVRAYATRTGLAGHTRNSLTDLVKLERELSQVRARVTRAITRNWSWASAASPPRFATTAVVWSRGCRCRRRQNGCRTIGSKTCRPLRRGFRPRSATRGRLPSRAVRRSDRLGRCGGVCHRPSRCRTGFWRAFGREPVADALGVAQA